MVYEPSAGGTAQCTGGGTTISGSDSDFTFCNQIVPGNVAALKVLGGAANARFTAYNNPDCTFSDATTVTFTQNSGCVAFPAAQSFKHVM
ncbi:hypothetical protein FB451DRAFT_1404908 [Mycena latifolia]|nr:hypothetical protein FB451DRAFT_1404908 [Mycena latifolia]